MSSLQREIEQEVYLELKQLFKGGVDELNSLIQEYIKKNENNPELEDLFYATIKKPINKNKEKKPEKQSEEKIKEKITEKDQEENKKTIKKEKEEVKIRTLINKSEKQVDDILNNLNTEKLKNVLDKKDE